MTTTATPAPPASGPPTASAAHKGTVAAGHGAGRSGAAVLLVLGSCTSLQAGAALAMRLFPVTGTPGATLLRRGLAAVVLLGVTRPRIRGWRPPQGRAGGRYRSHLPRAHGGL